MTVLLGGTIASVVGSVNGLAKIPFWIHFCMLIVFRSLFFTNTLAFLFPTIDSTTAANTYYSYTIYYELINCIFYFLGYVFMRYSLKNAAGILEYWNSIGSVCAGIGVWIALHTTLVLYGISNFWLGIIWAVLGIPCSLTVYFFVMKYMINSNQAIIKINNKNSKEYQSIKPVVITVYEYIYKTSSRLLAVCIGIGIFVSIVFLGQFFQYVWSILLISSEDAELYSALSTIVPIMIYMFIVWWFYGVQDDSTRIGTVTDECIEECSNVDLNDYKKVKQDSSDDSSDSDNEDKKQNKKNKKEKKQETKVNVTIV